MRNAKRRGARAGFTLLETVVALGIFAIGACAGLAVLVAATVTGRRAEHAVNATLLAESVLTDLEDEVASGRLTTDGLAVASRRKRPADFAPGPARAVPSARALAPLERDPFAEAPTYWLVRDGTRDAFPDYHYDVAVTPVGGPIDDPWELLVEVTVRWAEKGVAKTASAEGVFIRRG